MNVFHCTLASLHLQSNLSKDNFMSHNFTFPLHRSSIKLMKRKLLFHLIKSFKKLYGRRSIFELIFRMVISYLFICSSHIKYINYLAFSYLLFTFGYIFSLKIPGWKSHSMYHQYLIDFEFHIKIECYKFLR